MKIWILTSDSNNFSSLAIQKAFSNNNHWAEVLNPLHLSFEISQKSVDFFYNNQPIPKPDLAIPRLGWQSLDAGLIIGAALESAGCKVINPIDGYRLASHKLNSILKLTQSGIAVPKSKYSHPSQPSEFALLDDANQIFKQFHGSQGFGVTWSENRGQGISMIDFFRNGKIPFYSQATIRECIGKDLRVFVAGNKVLGSIERNNYSDLRSNIQKGGSATATIANLEVSQLAIKSVHSLGLFYGGVDVLISNKGPLVIEVNPAPGVEGISQALEIDIAQLLVNELLGAL